MTCWTVFSTVVRTNKGQITFFRKIYWGLIKDKFLEKFSTKQNIADFLFRLTIFGEKAQFADLLV